MGRKYDLHVYALVRVTYRGFEADSAFDAAKLGAATIGEDDLERILKRVTRDGVSEVHDIEAWGVEPEGNDKAGDNAVAIETFEPMDDGRLMKVPFSCYPKRASLLRFVQTVSKQGFVFRRHEGAVQALRDFVLWARALLKGGIGGTDQAGGGAAGKRSAGERRRDPAGKHGASGGPA